MVRPKAHRIFVLPEDGPGCRCATASAAEKPAPLVFCEPGDMPATGPVILEECDPGDRSGMEESPIVGETASSEVSVFTLNQMKAPSFKRRQAYSHRNCRMIYRTQHGFVLFRATAMGTRFCKKRVSRFIWGYIPKGSISNYDSP